MKKSKDFCNQIYKDLCAELGQLLIQKQLIDNQIKSLTAKIELLNGLSPRLQSLESEIALDTIKNLNKTSESDNE